jgi:hypothetical protein
MRCKGKGGFERFLTHQIVFRDSVRLHEDCTIPIATGQSDAEE